jgi:hypothetical protein
LNFFLAIFSGISWVCAVQTGFYRFQKKNLSLRWQDPLKEKLIFSQKLRHLEIIRRFDFPKKVFLKDADTSTAFWLTDVFSTYNAQT